MALWPIVHAQALSPESPYQAIVERNVFGLNPPPPPMTNNPAADEIPANIKFTGITMLGEQKKAWFIIQPKDPKEKPSYLSLPEGERSGVIEVVKIDEGSGEVKVLTGGKEMTLNFKENGNKVNAVPIAPAIPTPGIAIPGRAVPGVPPPPGGSPPLPGAMSIPPPPPPAFNRGNNSSVQFNSNVPAPPGGQPVSPALRTIPTRALRTTKPQQ